MASALDPPQPLTLPRRRGAGKPALALTAAPGRAQGDICTDAEVIHGLGLYPYSTAGASQSNTLSCASGPELDVWFRFTSGLAGSYTFSVCDASYDAVVGVFDGPCGTELGCSNDAPCTPTFNDASVTLNLEAATPYYVKRGGWNGATGTGTESADRESSGRSRRCADLATSPRQRRGGLGRSGSVRRRAGVAACTASTTASSVCPSR